MRSSGVVRKLIYNILLYSTSYDLSLAQFSRVVRTNLAKRVHQTRSWQRPWFQSNFSRLPVLASPYLRFWIYSWNKIIYQHIWSFRNSIIHYRCNNIDSSDSSNNSSHNSLDSPDNIHPEFPLYSLLSPNYSLITFHETSYSSRL